MLKILTLPALLLLCSFSPVITEKNICEAISTVTKAAKDQKWDAVVSSSASEEQYSSKIAITGWDDETVSYAKGESFSFRSVYNAKSYKDAKATFDKTRLSLDKCLGLKGELQGFDDGATLYYIISDKLKIEIDFFANENGNDW